MHAAHFDDLVQKVTAPGTRRRLVRHLAFLPLSGALGAVFAAGSEAAKHRHHAGSRHHARGHEQVQAQRKQKRKKPCAQAGHALSKKRKTCCAGLVKDDKGVCSNATPGPASPPPRPGCTPKNCSSNACGSVPDGCGGTLTCGGCAGNNLCIESVCTPCDVCPSGCLFNTIGQAMATANSGETIRICPGLYIGDVAITKNLTLIGAGDGNGAGNTILQGTGSVFSTVRTGARISASLQRLRITGGGKSDQTVGGGLSIDVFGKVALTGCTVTGNTAILGGGIYHQGASLTLTDCTVAGNTAFDGGGIYTVSAVDLVNSTVSGNSAQDAGGGISNGHGTVTLDATSRVAGNQANLSNPHSGGGILNSGTVTLSSADNVRGNSPDNCGGTAVPLCVG